MKSKKKDPKSGMSDINFARAMLSGGITAAFPDPRELSEYRCTIPKKYGAGTVGEHNPRARQGYYRRAISLDAAIAQLEKEFPGDKFEGELWKGPVDGFFCPMCQKGFARGQVVRVNGESFCPEPGCKSTDPLHI